MIRTQELQARRGIRRQVKKSTRLVSGVKPLALIMQALLLREKDRPILTSRQIVKDHSMLDRALLLDMTRTRYGAWGCPTASMLESHACAMREAPAV